MRFIFVEFLRTELNLSITENEVVRVHERIAKDESGEEKFTT